jgi:hypothetical protein
VIAAHPSSFSGAVLMSASAPSNRASTRSFTCTNRRPEPCTNGSLRPCSKGDAAAAGN